MDNLPISEQKKIILRYLQNGWRLLLFADNPHPAPQTVLLVMKDERLPIPYNVVLALQAEGLIVSGGYTIFGIDIAEEFTLPR